MKKFIYVFILITGLISCEKDDSTDKNVSVNGVTSNAEATGLVNAVYGPLQTLSSSYSFLLESATETTISFEEADDSKDGPQVSRLETTNSNWYPIKVFNRLYKSIGAANLAIEKIEATDVSVVNKANKDLYIARARFIRGYNYFQLVQLFGEVPLILSSGDNNKLRASIDDVYSRIEKDLLEAYPFLPEFDPVKSNPSKGAVNTILAKAYLTWGQKPLTQDRITSIAGAASDPAHEVDVAKLEKAAEYAGKVINSGKYELLSDFNKIWGDRNENNNEVIFSISHLGDGIDVQGNHQTHCGFTWPKNERMDPHISYADISLENRISDPNDKRKLYSYVTSVSYADGSKDTLTWPLSIVRPGKWIHRATDGTNLATDDQLNKIDHIDFRYAEVLLIKAEALFFLNRAGEALPLINQIRSRAGIANLTTLTREDLFKEWDHEFAFEQKHWLNLVRWKTLIKTIKEQVPAFEYYKETYKTSESIKASFPDLSNVVNAAFYTRVYKHLHAKTEHIDGHFYRFPVPLSESYTDLGITPQNPGY